MNQRTDKRNPARAATFSRGILRIPGIEALLGVDVLEYAPSAHRAPELGWVVGWGKKANTACARAYAARHALPFLTAEDGFLRSTGLGVRGGRPFSLLLDPLGIYYDATQPSALEVLLETGSLPPQWKWVPANPAEPVLAQPLENPGVCSRAEALMERIRSANLSKYNHAPPVDLPPTDRPRVLVVDQTAGDLSIVLGLAGPTSFSDMLAAALEENPEAEIWIKTHPDVVAGKKRGCLSAKRFEGRVHLLGQDANPLHLLRQMTRVYTVSSQLGFEALLVGRPVTCFGAPFYAGWGLTEDRVPIARRTARRSLTQVFAAAYLIYARYVDPGTGAPCVAERVVEHLETQRRRYEENQGTLYCFGVSLWKRRYVLAFLRSPGNRIVFTRFAWRARRAAQRAKRAKEPGSIHLLTWGQRHHTKLKALAEMLGQPLWRMEDGFLRSVGLGSDFTAPASLVVDKQGIYFDPTHPSDLESILSQARFLPEELQRAELLRQNIVNREITKYNFAAGPPLRMAAEAGQQVVLVPGQVEDDASIQLGCREVRTNLGLLQAVRAIRPHAYVIFKEHPDVVSGNRKGRVPPEHLRVLCDEVVREGSLPECLRSAHEVHTMTSLVGFEALLRGLPVYTYGLPFYAGWGLTYDKYSFFRRNRVLSLTELIAGCLIRYPRYINWQSGEFTSPEDVIIQLSRAVSRSGKGVLVRMPWLLRQVRKLKNLTGLRVHDP